MTAVSFSPRKPRYWFVSSLWAKRHRAQRPPRRQPVADPQVFPAVHSSTDGIRSYTSPGNTV